MIVAITFCKILPNKKLSRYQTIWGIHGLEVFAMTMSEILFESDLIHRIKHLNKERIYFAELYW